MKRAVSVSIGSSRRDKAVEIDLLGERVRLERIGTDGDMEKGARLYQELDGNGEGVKNPLEARLGPFIDQTIGDYINPRRVLVVTAVDRWGLTRSFVEAGYDCTFGDLMFGLGLPG